MKKLFLNLPQLGQGNWWVEIVTNQPFCIYYFGPFPDAHEAKLMQPGYVEDLTGEGINSIQAVVKQCYPTKLTVFEPEDSYLETVAESAYNLNTALG